MRNPSITQIIRPALSAPRRSLQERDWGGLVGSVLLGLAVGATTLLLTQLFV